MSTEKQKEYILSLARRSGVYVIPQDDELIWRLENEFNISWGSFTNEEATRVIMKLQSGMEKLCNRNVFNAPIDSGAS